ncbi:hypothetical protein J4032_21490 [Streptomyces formicae]|uniref:Uncharacterized protein n=1 Tax=Streptomyces formicae TaxID=1616117 RepID=A0ABY3WM19_9ACTN|nr:hypothetical protein J4032_21490 [Streptomyces formicae]
MDRGGRREQRRGQYGQQQRGDVRAALEGVEPGECGREGDGQKEGEQDLHARLGDPQLLEQLGEVAVGPLQLGLVTLGLVTLGVVTLGVVTLGLVRRRIPGAVRRGIVPRGTGVGVGHTVRVARTPRNMPVALAGG